MRLCNNGMWDIWDIYLFVNRALRSGVHVHVSFLMCYSYTNVVVNSFSYQQYCGT